MAKWVLLAPRDKCLFDTSTDNVWNTLVTIYTEWTPPRELDLLETEAAKEALVKCFTSWGQWLKKRQYERMVMQAIVTVTSWLMPLRLSLDEFIISLLWVSCWNRFMRPSHSVSFVNFLSGECERMINRSCSDWNSQIWGLFCYLVIILPRWHWWEFCSVWQKRERKAALKRSKSAPHVLEAELVFCSVNPSGSPETLVYAKIRNDN